MKKGVNLSIFFVLAFVLFGTSVHADSGLSAVKNVGNKLIAPLTANSNKDNKKAQTETKADITKTTDDQSAPTTQEGSKDETESQSQSKLQSIANQLQDLIDRTQDTMDKLQKRGVDTASAQNTLDSAVTSINKFQADLKILISLSTDSSTTAASDDKQTSSKAENKKEEEKIDAKTALKNVTDDLKDTRQFLIKSLTDLKASVALSLSANS